MAGRKTAGCSYRWLARRANTGDRTNTAGKEPETVATTRPAGRS